MLFFGIAGLIMLTFGIYTRSGKAKVWYLTQGVPVLMPIALQNMLIPAGITFIIWEIIASDIFPTVEMRQTLFGYIGMPALIITIILGMWRPRWLMPYWIRYLEDTYGEGGKWLLLQEARKDVYTWRQQVQTQAGLEAWAAETWHNIGATPPPDYEPPESLS